MNVFFLYRAFLAIVGITDTGATANHAFPHVRTIIAFITNPNECAWSHVAVANDTLAVT